MRKNDKFDGIYRAAVMDTNDPLKQGRVRLLVFTIISF